LQSLGKSNRAFSIKNQKLSIHDNQNKETAYTPQGRFVKM
jgi:hypothetical protein